MTASVNEGSTDNKSHGRWQTTGDGMRPIDRVLARLPGWTQNGKGYSARCPAHADKTPSLTISEAADGKVLLRCHKGCTPEAIVAAIDLTMADLFPRKEQSSRIVATYDYHDEQGTLLYQSVRYTPKNFKQRRPDGHGGWIWKMQGVRLVLYNLPAVVAAETIFIVEGEKDVETLRAWGLVATCNPMGAGKWRAEYSQSLAGKHVVVLRDNDTAGEEHAHQVTRSLFPVVASGKGVWFPGLPDKGDFSDWQDAGHTKEELLALVEAAPLWTEGEMRGEEPPTSLEQERDLDWPATSSHASLDAAQQLRATCDPDSLRTPVNSKKASAWEHIKPAPAFLAEEDKAFAGLAKDMLAPGAITLIAAPRGLGKTQYAHALANMLALGGVFRGEQLHQARVLLADRDNPEFLVKKRLRSWGAAKADGLHVLTRQYAPDLKDKAAWAAFPVASYDVVVIDSIGSSTEGVTEKEGKQTTEILATVLDLAHKGLAVLLLSNTIKDGSNIKGRGEWSDRVDILYEVRDATGFVPSGKKPWWLELPEAGESAWADRAARRKGRTDFRLGFICSKFRLGQEPEPFCVELQLPGGGELWTLEDVTARLVEAGTTARETAQRDNEVSLKKAEASLATLVTERSQQDNPILKTEAEQHLRESCGLKRNRARTLLESSPLWRLENRRQGDGKQAAWYLLPKIGGNGNESPSPPQSTVLAAPVVAVQDESGRQRSPIEIPLFHAGSSDFLDPLPLPSLPSEQKEGSATNPRDVQERESPGSEEEGEL